nr:hypothetical protein Iba_chr12eCG9500 [Ipomoea batatas]
MEGINLAAEEETYGDSIALKLAFSKQALKSEYQCGLPPSLNRETYYLHSALRTMAAESCVARILFTAVSSSPSSSSKFSALSSTSSEELSSISTDLLQERQSKAINKGLTSTLLEFFMDLLHERHCSRTNGLGTTMAIDERLMSSALMFSTDLLQEMQATNRIVHSCFFFPVRHCGNDAATMSYALEIFADLLHREVMSTLLKN